MKPFEVLKSIEDQLQTCKASGNEELDYLLLKALLSQERLLDSGRVTVYEQHQQERSKIDDYLFREYMVRHLISKFALTLSRQVTDKITGQDAAELSAVASCVKNRELYPEPAKKA